MVRIQNFINGEFVKPQNNAFMDNYDPSTGQVYSQLPESDELDVVFAIQAAKKAFEKWSKYTAEERSLWLHRIADAIEARLDDFAEAESRDVGKPLWLAKTLDIPRVIHNFRFFATRILHQEEIATDMDGTALNYTLRHPMGVAGLISPWNLPLYLLSWKIAPAIAVGNTVVCKPSEITPMTAYLLCEVLQKIGFPPGVINIVHGRGETAGSALVKHPAVPLISFTGGTETGIRIQEAAASFTKKLSLELGGKNANIIFADADFNKVVPMTIRSSFLNQGEICLCGSRIYVQEDVYKEFLAEFKKQTEELTVGDRKDPDIFMGPLVSQGHLDKVKTCIDQAKREQGEILSGGTAPTDLPAELKNGYFLRPTIVTDLTDCSDLMQREIFGPVVTVRPFKYQHEAVKWANTGPYGLSASVWTSDISRAHKVASQLQVGTVWVNTWMKRDLRVPFGGMKASGVGREGGDFSLDFYTERKTVCVQL